MSSREIAELVEVRHDSVKRAIERLADREVIEFPPSVEIPTATKPVTVYQINKRDSYVIVAQLSPEFTARLVDRWQELEAKTAKPVALPGHYLSALKALVTFTLVAEKSSGWTAQRIPARSQQDRRRSISGQYWRKKRPKVSNSKPDLWTD